MGSRSCWDQQELIVVTALPFCWVSDVGCSPDDMLLEYFCVSCYSLEVSLSLGSCGRPKTLN